MTLARVVNPLENPEVDRTLTGPFGRAVSPLSKLAPTWNAEYRERPTLDSLAPSCLSRAQRFSTRGVPAFQVVDFCPNVVQMLSGDFANLATGRFLRSAQPKQGADFVKRKAQLARASYEDQVRKSATSYTRRPLAVRGGATSILTRS